MKKQSYVVTFCSSATSATSEPSSPIMERKQGSSTNLLIDSDDPQKNGDHLQSNNLNVAKMDRDDRNAGDDGPLSALSTSSAKYARIRDKFRGCLLGALVGDCIGSLFERDYSVSYNLLEDLYHSLTNLSEDEKLMDLHGIDSNLDPKRLREILETKRQSYANLLDKDEDMDRLKPLQYQNIQQESTRHQRRCSALESGTATTIPANLGGVSSSRRGSFSRPIERYSNDTVMTKSVLYSLVKCKGFDARHMARQMTEDYFLNLNRKFGGYIRDVFVQLRENGYADPYSPAKKYASIVAAQGSEAASRVSPIALFCWGSNEQMSVIDLASKLAKITNANKAGVHGSVLQALAVHTAFNWEFQRETCCPCGTGGGGEDNTGNSSSSSSRHGSPLLLRRRQSTPHATRGMEISAIARVLVEQQPKYFCEQILEKMNSVEGRASSLFENLKSLVQNSVSGVNGPGSKEFLKSAELTYCDKLRTILEFLARSHPPTRIEVIERLGNGFKAIDSVPAAVYSFLFATKYDMLPEMSTPIKSPILRCIFHACSLGGETDTLASMAGAIAGAYWGQSQIPSEILRVCEGSKEVLKLADELFNVAFKNKSSNSCPSCHQQFK